MSARRSALGRGLGALIPSHDTAEQADAAAGPLTAPASAVGEGGFLEIAVDAIQPNPDQPRRRFEPSELAGLADSITRLGVLQPVVVRRAAAGGYELIVGERRWRASRAAGKKTVPAVVADVEPRERLELALVENVQRCDLNPIELAHAYHALASSGATQDEIGARVGLDRSSIANHLRLLELPRDFQEDIESGRLSMGHAKALLQVANPERRQLLRDRIVRDQLSVRATEQLARDYAGPVRSRKPKNEKTRRGTNGEAASDPSLAPFAEALRRHLQTQVRIEGGIERGHIEIDYFGAEDLERIADLLIGGT